MRVAYLAGLLAAAVWLAAPTSLHAADTLGVTRAPVSSAAAPVAAAAQDPAVIEQAEPLQGPPAVRYGCKRIWRCDAVVCEWRRGCWGTYGYMEGPYYTLELAKRQWERHGWPVPRQYSQRYPLQTPSK
jgi:hypothetical protein